MATIAQIRGLLLEEALLHLLKAAGYRTVEDAGGDPTVKKGPSGLEVVGRGERHQIDAIADFVVAPPFSHPQRLLLEAKCVSNRVTLPIIRNAVGVLKDVSEYWVPSVRRVSPPKSRYHYQYAVFSVSGFTSGAERYAFAQDIYLIPLEKSRYLRPIIDSIRDVTYQTLGATESDKVVLNTFSLRKAIRSRIENPLSPQLASVVGPTALETLNHFCATCQSMQGAALGMIAKRFPVFLVPSPEVQLGELEAEYHVSVHWDNEGWYLQEARTDRRLFSFDLPEDLFEMYAEEGMLTRTGALELKAEMLSEIQAVVALHESVRLLIFRLDMEWLQRVRARLRVTRRPR